MIVRKMFRPLAVSGLTVLVSAGAAQATTETVACTNGTFTWTYYIDLSNKTVQTDYGHTHYRVPARITDQKIEWDSGVERNSLDRYSGVLNTINSDPSYQAHSAWTCQKILDRKF